jgi:hypothetical protein
LFKSLIPVYIARTESLHALKQQYIAKVQGNLLDSDDGSLHEIQHLVSSIDQNTERIRVWDNVGRLLSRNKTTLKKYGVANGAILTFEFLAMPEQLSTNATLMYLYQWLPPTLGNDNNDSPSSTTTTATTTATTQCAASVATLDTDTASNTTTVSAPAIPTAPYGSFDFRGQVVLDNAAPTLADLKACVAPCASRSIATESLAIAKYFFHKQQWVLLRDLIEDDSGAAQSSGKKANANNKDKDAAAKEATMRNLRKNECKLAHGDILVMFDAHSTATPIDALFQSWLSDSRLPRKISKPMQSGALDSERVFVNPIYSRVVQEAGGVEINIGDIEGVPDF